MISIGFNFSGFSKQFQPPQHGHPPIVSRGGSQMHSIVKYSNTFCGSSDHVTWTGGVFEFWPGFFFWCVCFDMEHSVTGGFIAVAIFDVPIFPSDIWEDNPK